MHQDGMATASGVRWPIVLSDIQVKSHIGNVVVTETYLYLCDPFVIHKNISLSRLSLGLVVWKIRLKIAQETAPALDNVGLSDRQPFYDGPLPILSGFTYGFNGAKAPGVEIQHTHTHLLS